MLYKKIFITCTLMSAGYISATRNISIKEQQADLLYEIFELENQIKQEQNYIDLLEEKKHAVTILEELETSNEQIDELEEAEKNESIIAEPISPKSPESGYNSTPSTPSAHKNLKIKSTHSRSSRSSRFSPMAKKSVEKKSSREENLKNAPYEKYIHNLHKNTIAEWKQMASNTIDTELATLITNFENSTTAAGSIHSGNGHYYHIDSFYVPTLQEQQNRILTLLMYYYPHVPLSYITFDE